MNVPAVAPFVSAARPALHLRRQALRVLIANGNPVVRRGLHEILTDESDMSVVGEASDGGGTIALMRAVGWDVALLEFSMPGRGGAELVQEVKRAYPRRAIVVLMTNQGEAHARLAFRAGASGCLDNGCAAEELAAAIRKVALGGRYITPGLAESLAANFDPARVAALHETLTSREYRVLWLLAQGKRINTIAREMLLSPSTISTYRARVLKKLGVVDNAALVRYAVEHRVIA